MLQNGCGLEGANACAKYGLCDCGHRLAQLSADGGDIGFELVAGSLADVVPACRVVLSERQKNTFSIKFRFNLLNLDLICTT